MLRRPNLENRRVRPGTVPFWRRDLKELLTGMPAARRVKPRDTAVFCRKFACMLEAGMPVKTAVALLSHAADSRAMKASLRTVQERIMKGESLSHALSAAGTFPVFLCALCEVGELSAQLPQVMLDLSEFYEQQARTEDELAAALMYPAAVTLLMLSVMIMAVVYVLPQYTAVFVSAGVPLPTLTRVLMGVGEWLSAYALFLVGGILSAALGLAFALKTPSGRSAASWIQLYTPGLRLLTRLTVSLRLAQSLSLLLRSGRSLIQAVPAAMGVIGQVRVQRDLQQLVVGLEEGHPFWVLLTRIPYIDPMLPGMARIGEETGRLPQTLLMARQYLRQEHDTLVRRMNKLVEPVITILLGLMLGLVMMSIMLPTFSLTQVA